MLQHIITAIVNLLSFFSVETTINTVQPFLAAFFVFACSIFLEAMSLHDSLKQEQSIVILALTVVLYITSVCCIIVILLGLLGYLQFQLAVVENTSSHLFITSAKDSLLYIPCIDVTFFVIAFGFIAIFIPLILCARLFCLGIVRRRYVLALGFYGK